MIPLYLPSSLARQIEQEAVRAYPNECCGILIGRDLPPLPARERVGVRGETRFVERLRSTENVFDAPERFHRFSIDPRQLMAAERDALDGGQVVLGFYHSHPDHPARPSDFDRQRAWPFYSYVIISIIQRQPVDMTSWVLHDQTNTFERQDIIEGD